MKWHSVSCNSKYKIIAGIAAAFFLLFCAARALHGEQHTAQPVVMDLKLDGEVEPVLATYIEEGLPDAARRNASLVLITMNNPAGHSESIKDIMQHTIPHSVPL